jgi:hypothetical protein
LQNETIMRIKNKIKTHQSIEVFNKKKNYKIINNLAFLKYNQRMTTFPLSEHQFLITTIALTLISMNFEPKH